MIYDGPRTGSWGLTRVCLYHDSDPKHPLPKQSVQGFLFGKSLPFRHGWKSYVGDPTAETPQCEETLLADIKSGTIYLGFENPLPSSAGVPTLRCVLDSNGMWDLRCNSVFLKRDDSASYRVVDLQTTSAIIEEANVAESLDKFAEAKWLQDERLAYTSLRTLEDIEWFEETYRSADPANLLPDLAQLKLRLLTQQYRSDYAQATSIRDLSTFVTKYGDSDPDGLVPEAKRQLVIARQLEAKEQERKAAEQERADRVKKVAELEVVIKNCKGAMTDAYHAIERENEAGAISGYVNKWVLMRSGETIVECRKEIEDDFSKYRRAGGQKTLAAIQ